jgi:hypothetical protein
MSKNSMVIKGYATLGGQNATDMGETVKSKTDYSVFFDKQFCHVTPESRKRHQIKHLKYLVYELIATGYIAGIFIMYAFSHDRSDVDNDYFSLKDFTVKNIPKKCYNK